MEDRHSGHRIDPHGSPDCPRNDLMYGVWICCSLSEVKEKGLTDFNKTVSLSYVWKIIFAQKLALNGFLYYLCIGNDGINLSFKKTTSDMTAKFDTWSKTDGMIDVPQPAKYTMFVYGNAGGKMDGYK